MKRNVCLYNKNSMSCPTGSYCKSWQNPPVCQGTNTPCGFTPPPPVVKTYSCTTGTCVEDPKSSFNNCADACAQTPQPNPPGPVYGTLTCVKQRTVASNDPFEAKYLYNASTCPVGYEPQFCCEPNGATTWPLIDNDPNSGNVYCPKLGSIITTIGDYQPTCSTYPSQKCCGEGVCYDSLTSDCERISSSSGSLGGYFVKVASCDECPPANPAICCVPDQSCGPANGPTCPPGSQQVPDCSFCSMNYVTCCNRNTSTGTCYTQLNQCNSGDDQITGCDQCGTNLLTCCHGTNCYQQKSCNLGDMQVGQCSDCANNNPSTFPYCCMPGVGCMQSSYAHCPPGTNQVPDCSPSNCNVSSSMSGSYFMRR